MPIHTKIINKNFPEANALSQINYENGVQLGIGDIADLYTLNEEYDYNEDNLLLYPDGIRGGNIWMYKGSSIEIVSGWIDRTGVNYGVSDVAYSVYFLDDRNPISVNINSSSGNSIKDILGDGDELNGPSDFRLFYKNVGYMENDVNIGEITDDSDATDLIVSDIPGDPKHKGSSFTGIQVDLSQFSDDIGLTIPGEFDSSFYIVIRCAGNADDYGTDDLRNRSYTKYKLPKSLLSDMWIRGSGYKSNQDQNYEIFYWGSKSEGDTIVVGMDEYVITTKVGDTPTYSTDNYGVGDETGTFQNDVQATAFIGGELAIKVIPPTWNVNDVPSYLPEIDDSNPDIGELGWSWVNINDDNNHIYLTPKTLIDYTNLYVDSQNTILFEPIDIFNYRPISIVSIESPDDEIDIQSWYDFGTDGFIFGAAPNIVKLRFRITDDIKNNNFTLDYFEYNSQADNWILSPSVSSQPGTGFKFFVIDWDADDDNIEWDYGPNPIINQLPYNWTQLEDKRGLYDTFYYTDLIDDSGNYNFLEHEYDEAGVKIIKALVFSYIKHSEDPEYIQALRWKAVAIRVNLNYDTNVLEDFSDIGGADFTYIPWPYSTAVIGGISNESAYVNSIENIISENRFESSELVDYYRTLLAFNNKPGGVLDELGDSLGKSDIAQVRYFSNGSFDMNNLIGLTNYVSGSDGNLYSYDNFEYWQGDPCVHSNQYICTDFPTYPKDSCVGLIFINDNMRQELRDNCDIELNPIETYDNSIADSNGNDVKGIMMGDYNLKKSKYGEPISRISSPIVPGIENKDGAF